MAAIKIKLPTIEMGNGIVEITQESAYSLTNYPAVFVKTPDDERAMPFVLEHHLLQDDADALRDIMQTPDDVLAVFCSYTYNSDLYSNLFRAVIIYEYAGKFYAEFIEP